MNFLRLFYQQLVRNQQLQRNRGFTLIELLVSLIIGSIIVVVLMDFVIDLVRVDRRETVLDQVQRDMNRALDYIADDLQEAVYIYAGAELTNVVSQLDGTNPNFGADPNFPSSGTPVLAFWRVDPIESAIPDCSTVSATITPPRTTSLRDDCRLLEVRQAAYTLVVYVQVENTTTTPNWSGQSRIVRYELPKFSNVATLATNSGYNDPSDQTLDTAQFPNWQATGIPSGNQDVLVDYVQAPSAATLNRAPLSDAGVPCDGYGNDNFGNSLYVVVPPTASTTTNNSFFACVRNPNLDNATAVANNSNGNQDIYVFLRGNVQGINGGVRSFSDYTSLPILETQVLAKGVINKGQR